MGLDSELSDIQCFDFDRAVLNYWRWFDGKQNEQMWVTPPKVPKGKVSGSKYPNDAAIMRLYYGKSILDPIVAAITPEELEADMNDFSDLLLGRVEIHPEA